MNYLPIQTDVSYNQSPRRNRSAAPDSASLRIMGYVAERYGVPVAWMLDASKEADCVAPRHIAMYLIRDLQKLSLPRIGRIFGARHHTTVLHALHKVQRGLSAPRVAAFLEQAKRDLAGLALTRRTRDLYVPDVLPLGERPQGATDANE